MGEPKKQALDRVVDSSGGRLSRCRDGLHGTSLRHLFEQVLVEGVELTLLTDRRDDRPHYLGIEHRAARGHLSNCSSELVSVSHSVLQEIGVAGGTFTQEGDRVLRIVVLRQHHHAGAQADALGVRARRTGGVDELERVGRKHQNGARAAGDIDAREQDVCDLGIGRAIAARNGGQDRIDDCRFAGGHLGHKFLLKIWVAMAQATS